MSDSKESKTIWYPAYRVSPAQFGLPGWQMLMGLAWLVDQKPQQRWPIFARIARLLPHFLMCIWCSGHFYTYQQTRPKSETMSCLEWMHQAWRAVTERSFASEDETSIELWIKERWLSIEEIRAYYEKRMTRYRSLWIEQVMLFLTTLMRCLPRPEEWSRSLATDLVEFLTCIHTLVDESPSPSLSPFRAELQASTKVWSSVWLNWISRQMGGSMEEANRVLQTSTLCLPISKLPVAGAVSFVQPTNLIK